MSAVAVFASGLDHPEGVAWDATTRSLIAGGEAGQIYRVSLDGTVERSATTEGFCLGIAVDTDGVAYVCDMARSEVLRVHPTGSVDVFLAASEETPVRVPNFPVLHESGRLYVSDSGSWTGTDGTIILVEPDGRSSVVDTGGAFTNGLAVSADGEWLYVVESALPGITRRQIAVDGSLGLREPYVDMPGTVPDGLAVAADGTLLIACYRPDRIYAFDGRQLQVVYDDWQAMTVAAPTNLAFFGDDLDRLVTANLHGSHLTEITTSMRGLQPRQVHP